MSSELSGTLRVQRQNPRLRSLAAMTLDPRRLAGWVQAGRTQALEAGRLLAITNAERTARLYASLEGNTVEALPGTSGFETPLLGANGLRALPGASVLDAPPGTGEAGLLETAPLEPLTSADSDEIRAALGDASLPSLLAAADLFGKTGAPSLPAPREVSLEVCDDVTMLEDADLAELLESDTLVLCAAAEAALAAEGFAIVSREPRLVGASVRGRRGEQEASVLIDDDGEVVVEVGVPGFSNSRECEATRDALVKRLDGCGLAIDVDGAGSGLGEAERDLASAVEDAVTKSLPGFRIRSIVEGDELQVIAVPPTSPRVKGEDSC